MTDTITLPRSELQEILDAWDNNRGFYMQYAMTRIRERLAEPEKEQEPVAWMHTTATGETYFRKKPHDKVFNPKPVYTTLPQREWQGLTDDEVWALWESHTEQPFPEWFVDFRRAYAVIEQALKEKNT